MLKWILTMSADDIHEIRKNGNIFFLINAFIGAYNRRTDVLAQSGNSQFPDLTLIAARLETVHGLVFDLNRKVDEFMATQEERLRGVKTKLDAIQSGVDKIQQQLADLKANNPELDDEISAIEATAAAIDTDVNPVTPEPEPTPTEPAPADSGGTR